MDCQQRNMVRVFIAGSLICKARKKMSDLVRSRPLGVQLTWPQKGGEQAGNLCNRRFLKLLLAILPHEAIRPRRTHTDFVRSSAAQPLDPMFISSNKEEMRRFKNILVYVNTRPGEHRALDRAKQLAIANNASLHIVSGVEDTSWWTDTIMPGIARRWQEKFVEETDERLATIAAGLADELDVTTKTLIGRPWMETVREVLKGGHDLLIKDADERDSPEGLFSHGMNFHLLRKCPCPVWLVKRQVERFHRIAAAVDCVPDGTRQNDLNGKILDLAAALAVDQQSELHVVQSWSLYGESVLKSHMTEEDLQEAKSQMEQKYIEATNSLVKQYAQGLPDVNVHVLEGPPESNIPTLVEREHEDLLVMGTIARTGVAGLIIGNTAEQILRELKCSVLAVKPDGYESPVNIED